MFCNKAWVTCFAQISLKNATVKIKDGGAQEITVTIGEGNLTYSENVEREYVLDRGNLDTVRDGDDQPVQLSFDFTWEYITSSVSTTGGDYPTVEDALKQAGDASDWVSSDTDACAPYAVDIEVTYAPTPSTCGDKEIITFADFRYETLDHDLRAGTVSCSGRANITKATVVRSVQS